MAKKQVVPVKPISDGSLRKVAAKVKQDLVASGQALPDELIEKGAMKIAPEYEGIESKFPNLSADYYDEFEDYGMDESALKGRASSLEDLRQARFEYQTLGQEASHAVGRIATNIVPQIIGGFASMVDIPGYFDAEHAANNSIVNWAQGVQDWSKEAMPIYTDPSKEGMDLGSSAWWFDRGEGLVTSVGAFLAQGAGMGKLVSLGAQGLSTVLRGKDLARAIFGATEATQGTAAFAKGVAKSKWLLDKGSTLANAVAVNQSEAVIEAAQVYKTTYEKGIQGNMSAAEARQNAANAASTTMNLNRLNIMLNLTSASAFVKPTALSRKILTAPSVGKNIGHLAIEGGQESLEELINHVASQAGLAKGEKKDYTWKQAMKDMSSSEGMEAAFLGVFGGIVQTGGINALKRLPGGMGSTVDENGNKVSSWQQEKNDYAKQQAVINKMKEDGVNYTTAFKNAGETLAHFKEMMDAQNAGDTKKVEELNNQRFEKMVYDAASSGTVGVLEDILQHEASKNVDEVGQEHIDNAKRAIEKLHVLEAVYNNVEGYANVSELYQNRSAKITAEDARNAVGKEVKTNDLAFQQAVEEIAKKYNFTEKTSTTKPAIVVKKDGKVQETIPEVVTEGEVKVPIRYDISDIEKNTGTTPENQATYEAFLKEVASVTSNYKNDAGEVLTLLEAKKELESQHDHWTQKLKEVNDDYRELTSKKGQEKAIAKQEEQAKIKEYRAEMRKPNITISQLEKMKDATTDPDFHSEIALKIAEIKKGQAVQNSTDEKKLKVKALSKRIKQATTPEQLAAIGKEYNDAKYPLTKEMKLALDDFRDKRAQEIAAKKPTEAAEQEEEEEDPLAKFTHGQQDDTASKNVKQTTEEDQAKIPTDLPPSAKGEEKNVETEIEEGITILKQNDATNISGTDENGKPIYNFGRPHEASNRGAVLNREFAQTEDGQYINRTETNDEIINHQVLDPEGLQKGTELQFSVDTEYTGNKYDIDSNTRGLQAKTWPEREAELKAKYGENYKTSHEYIMEVPIKVTDKDGNTLFYLHDTGWYREENVDNTEEEIERQHAANYAQRVKILAEGTVKSQVSYKSFGTLFKTFDGRQIPVAEAMPDEDLVLAVGKDGAYLTGGKKIDGKIINSSEATNGKTYAIVQVGPKAYMALPLARTALPATVAKEGEEKTIGHKVLDSIELAITAWLDPENHSEIIENIKAEKQQDISTIDGLKKYIEDFIYLYPTQKSESFEDLLHSNALQSDRPLIVIDQFGIKFGVPGINLDIKNKKRHLYIKKSSDLATSMNNLRVLMGTRVLRSGNILQAVNKERLKPGQEACFILDTEGNTETIPYKDYIKGSHKTNLLSVNIGTQEKPKYVYTIQPAITFDTTPLTGQETTHTAATRKKPVTVEKTSDEYQEVLAQLVNEVDLENLQGMYSNAVDGSLTPRLLGSNLSQEELIKVLAEAIGIQQTGGKPKTNVDAEADIENKIKAFNNTIENEFEEGDYNKVLTLAEKQVKDGTIPQTPENIQLLTNYPKLFEELIKATDARNKTISEFDKEKVLAGTPNELPIYGIESSINPATGRLEIKWVEVRKEAITNIQLTKIQNYAATELINYKNKLQQELAALKGPTTTPSVTPTATTQAVAKTGDIKITAPDGSETIITDDEQDIDDETDYSLGEAEENVSELEAEQIQAIKDEISELVIDGIGNHLQSSLISYIASGIVTRTLAAKDVEGKRSVDTRAVFADYESFFRQLKKAYIEKGLVNKANRIEKILSQWSKVNNLTKQYLNLLSTGTVREDSIELDENEEQGGLEKTVYQDDWSFSIDSFSTASADLRKFFAGVKAVGEDGKPINTILGFPEIVPVNIVYNTLHEILAGTPADYDRMISILEARRANIPWVGQVIKDLEKAPEKVQNEFVSDMAKHNVNMKFVMWSKDFNGNYQLGVWSANSSSVEQRLRDRWGSNLKGFGTKSALVVVNENDEYILDKNETKQMDQMYKTFASDPSAVTNEDLAIWLGKLGIVLTDSTYDALRSGKFSNKGKHEWKDLFTKSTGLVKVLMDKINAAAVNGTKLEDIGLMSDTVVKSLAKIDALYTRNTNSNSHQAGGKTIYSYTNNNYLANRMRDLVDYDYSTGEFRNKDLISGLKSLSFTQDSLWLKYLTEDSKAGEAMREILDIGYLSLEAIKKHYGKTNENGKLNQLTDAEHELVKVAMFQAGSKLGLDGEDLRKVNYFYQTMSDKTTMLTITAIAQTLEITKDGSISDQNIQSLYDAAVLPEIKRIRTNKDDASKTKGIKGFEGGYFYFLPDLNDVELELESGEKVVFLDAVIDGTHNQPEIQKAVKDYLQTFIKDATKKKVEEWARLGIGLEVKDGKGKILEQNTFLDKTYMSNIAKSPKGMTKVEFAAMDYVFNSMIANAEMQKLFIGDPALYAKFQKDKSLRENLTETFINLGKRLAGDIAPGLELANSVDNRYYQIFLQDKKIDSNNMRDELQKEFFQGVMDNYGDSDAYRSIEGSDAQEYTTWKEHLFVLRQLGRITTFQYNQLYAKLDSQTKHGVKNSNKLGYEDLGLVLQPIKPVYVGNSLEVDNNVDRRVYIKSSSFPLIPELTSGFGLDKLRVKLEEFQDSKADITYGDGNQGFVRASFGTANKVGANATAVEVFDKDGFVLDGITIGDEHSMLLERKNFRIQQDVPYKRDKDKVNAGVQEAQLLLVDLLETEIEEGVTGQDIKTNIETAYKELYEYAKEELEKKLGLVKTVTETPNIEVFTEVETNIVSETTDRLEAIKSMSAIEKVTEMEKIANEMGEDTIERVNFINQNFDAITAALANSGMEIFKPEEGKEFKEC